MTDILLTIILPGKILDRFDFSMEPKISKAYVPGDLRRRQLDRHGRQTAAKLLPICC